jgi:hypothetical protein
MLPNVVFQRRVLAVYRAICGTRKFAHEALLAMGDEVRFIADTLLPGLLMMVGIVCVSTVGGAAAGAALGVFTGPGLPFMAASGAAVGVDAGLFFCALIGLKFLLDYVARPIADGLALAERGVKIAWHSIESNNGAEEINRASKTIAEGVIQVLRGLLQGLAFYLVAKGVKNAYARVGELVPKLRESRFGGKLADAVEKNWRPLLRYANIEPQAGELEMLQMMKYSEYSPDQSRTAGSTERGVVLRSLQNKYVIRGEAAADKGAGDWFNGPYDSASEANAAAARLAADTGKTGLRPGNAIPRVWVEPPPKPGEKPSPQRPTDVIRVYRITEDVVGIQSIAKSQPEAGKVMLRAQHLQAAAKGDPSIANEYPGGNVQVQLPVKGMRTAYGVNIVERVPGSEYPYTVGGTPFVK